MGNLTSCFSVRAACPGDAEAVGALLRASYPSLMAPGYEPEVLARALPLMTKASPALLSCGTWYVVELLCTSGALAGCGGWTLQRPGAPNEPVDPAIGHIRHFATHPSWIRRGIGRVLLERCVTDARASGVRALECYSSTVAEPFYRALGFETVGPIMLAMGGCVALPSVHMLYRLGD